VTTAAVIGVVAARGAPGYHFVIFRGDRSMPSKPARSANAALSRTVLVAKAIGHPVRLRVFERYLSLWVGLCMVAGVVLGKAAPGFMAGLRGLEFGEGSQINVPIAVLIWLMITPMMMKVDFGAIRDVGRRPRGLFVTLFVNWLVKPFSMALIAWFFFRLRVQPVDPPADADQYIAGCIILAAAPCTAMVFVWSYLSDGDPAYTLVQVSVNDLIMLVLFAPIVRFLVSGASSLHVPFEVLLYSVMVFIVIPLAAGVLLRHWFIGEGPRVVRARAAAALRAGQHAGAARHARADLRVPGRQHHRQDAARGAHRGADPDPGLLQLVADLRADAAVPRRVRRRGARAR
jgi:hypothetical protein